MSVSSNDTSRVELISELAGVLHHSLQDGEFELLLDVLEKTDDVHTLLLELRLVSDEN